MKGARLITLVTLFAFLVVPYASAQEKPPDFLYVVWETIKPGTAKTYEDYIKKIVEGANKIGAPQYWSTFNIAIGGPSNTYIYALGFNEWKEIDNWPYVEEILTKAYGDDEGAKILRSGRSCTTSTETRIRRTLGDLSTHFKTYEQPFRFHQATRIKVKPEKMLAYNLILAKVKAAEEKLPNAPTAIRRMTAMGPSPTYLTTRGFNKWEEHDSWLETGEILSKAFGDEEAREIMESFVASVESLELFVIGYRPGLSRRRSEAPTTN